MFKKYLDTMHDFIQNHVVAIDNLAQFCTLSGYTCSFHSLLTRFVVKYGLLFVLTEECNRNSEELISETVHLCDTLCHNREN